MKYLNLKGYYRPALLAIVICCFAIGAMAQAATTITPPAAPATAAKPAVVVTKTASNIIDSFFKKYKDDGTGPAIDYLFGTNKLFTDSAQISVLKTKLDALRQTLGDYVGKELIIQKDASASLVFYAILVKHEKSPLRFTFMFYKPKNDWVLYRFKYDDQMDAELEDAGKITNRKTL
jgi:hypothetical protein